MNRAAANRTISKQEAMILAAGLDLVDCSDVIETVSLSGSYRLSRDKSSRKTIVHKYANRDLSGPLAGLSLDQFYRELKHSNARGLTPIPHYVGGRSQPVYPVTSGYARAVLIIHKPWHESDPREDKDDISWIKEFEAFLEKPECPQTVKIPYERVKNRFIEKATHKEAVGEAMKEREVDEDDHETRELLDIVATFQQDVRPDDGMSAYKYHRGQDYDWGMRVFKVSRKPTPWTNCHSEPSARVASERTMFFFTEAYRYQPSELPNPNLTRANSL